MLLASFEGVRNVRTLCFTSSGLPSYTYRLGCASAWLADVVVVVYGPGRVYQRLQRGAVGLGSCHYARQMANDHAAVDLAARS